MVVNDVQIGALIALVVALIGATVSALLGPTTGRFQRAIATFILVLAIGIFVSLFIGAAGDIRPPATNPPGTPSSSVPTARITVLPSPTNGQSPVAGCLRDKWETGPGVTATTSVEIPAGCVLIIEAFRVNGNGDGVFEALRGPISTTYSIQDGALWFLDELSARGQFCAIVADGRRRQVAMGTVRGLPDWAPCP